jgi:hypothetical protein
MKQAALNISERLYKSTKNVANLKLIYMAVYNFVANMFIRVQVYGITCRISHFQSLMKQ